ncbi:nudix hydrolase 8-like isoform X1 [Actinia tenebrosa]|uniref:Nudix hydrolase 8-like isoform X1 n=1 Tax=Actinia tenebrosa TaxID=6105 RepID=A0A6P8HE09_ACTTE|nr:nudix hydrolase 8-like isoform X1 [Actinia tenebrosa]
MMADYTSLKKVDNVFKGSEDIFSGLTIDMTTEDQNYDNEQFATMLKESLVNYKRYGVRGVWFKIPIKKSSFVPITVEHGFVFHHCFPSYIVMTKWLPEDEPNKLPTFATCFIGVAGFVVNDEGKLLVVQERFRKSDHWKLPGGMADHKEDIRTAGKREVLEETGIETEFVSMVCFRHIPDFRFECSDLYFICLLKPLNNEIKRDSSEISDAKWMDLDEFLSSPIVNGLDKFVAQQYKDQKLKMIPTDMFMFNRDIIFYTMELPPACNKL